MKKTNPLLQRLHGSSVVVAGALDAQTIIEDPSTAPAVKGVLSIADPPGYAQHIHPKLPDAPTHVRLDFLDRINPGYGGPEREHVERILAWGRQFPEFFTGRQRIGYGGPLNDCGPKSLVLIHCFAGISRSTASAYVCFAQALGPGREKEAAEMLVRSTPRPSSTATRGRCSAPSRASSRSDPCLASEGPA